MAEFNFDPFLTGGAGDFAGQVGGYDIGAQPTPTVTAQPEFTGSATQYAPETTFQMPTEMPTFAAYDPTFAFQPTVTAPTAYAAPQNQFAGPISQPAISPALQRAYTSSAQPLPDIIRQFAGPAGTSATGGLYAAPSEAATPDAAQAGGGLSDILKSLGGVKGLTSIAGGLMGYLANQKAQQQAQDIGDKIKAAYQSAAGQTRQLAQPYITAGAPQLSMALQGALGLHNSKYIKLNKHSWHKRRLKRVALALSKRLLLNSKCTKELYKNSKPWLFSCFLLEISCYHKRLAKSFREQLMVLVRRCNIKRWLMKLRLNYSNSLVVLALLRLRAKLIQELHND
jgi:hypothetical protein